MFSGHLQSAYAFLYVQTVTSISEEKVLLEFKRTDLDTWA